MFTRYNQDGVYNIFNAKNYPFFVLFKMWERGRIQCSPRLEGYFQSRVEQVKKAQSEHLQKVFADKNKQKMNQKLVLRGI